MPRRPDRSPPIGERWRNPSSVCLGRGIVRSEHGHSAGCERCSRVSPHPECRREDQHQRSREHDPRPAAFARLETLAQRREQLVHRNVSKLADRQAVRASALRCNHRGARGVRGHAMAPARMDSRSAGSVLPSNGPSAMNALIERGAESKEGSDDTVAGSPSSCSGAMYAGVPEGAHGSQRRAARASAHTRGFGCTGLRRPPERAGEAEVGHARACRRSPSARCPA